MALKGPSHRPRNGFLGQVLEKGEGNVTFLSLRQMASHGIDTVGVLCAAYKPTEYRSGSDLEVFGKCFAGIRCLAILERRSGEHAIRLGPTRNNTKAEERDFRARCIQCLGRSATRESFPDFVSSRSRSATLRLKLGSKFQTSDGSSSLSSARGLSCNRGTTS